MANVPWGPVGYITYKRTYARPLPSGRTEEYSETLSRCIEGLKRVGVRFESGEDQELYNYLYKLKCMLSGRSLWQLGTDTVDKIGGDSLQSCWTVAVREPKAFVFTFEQLMLGGGVGFNIEPKYVYEMPQIKSGVKIKRHDIDDVGFIVPDNREGWCELLSRVLNAYFYTGRGFTYSTSCIRSKGSSIKSFGGTASGPEMLVYGITQICNIFRRRVGQKLRPIDCLDIMNIIGMIVVSGNVRRSAEIALCTADKDFLNAKRWDLLNIPNWRAMSNNTIITPSTHDLPNEFWEGYKGNGEPYGLLNLDLCRYTGRTKFEYETHIDNNVIGVNPCVTADTKILTVEGEQRIDTIKEGTLVPCIDAKDKLVIRKVVNPRKTGVNQPIYKMTLDDGMIIRATGNHKFKKRNNMYCRLDNLKVGDSLCVLHKYYPNYANHSRSNQYVGYCYKDPIYYEHQLVADYKYGSRKPNMHINHKDGDKGNNHPDNIEYVSLVKHLYDHSYGASNPKYSGYSHQEILDAGINLCRILKRKFTTREWAAYAREEDLPQSFSAWRARELGSMKYFIEKCYAFYKSVPVDNHKIVSIEPDGYEDVWNVTVEDCSNYFLGGQHQYTAQGKEKTCYINSLNCGEITLENYESCNLSEVFLPNIEDVEEFKRVATLLYKACKGISNLGFIYPETNEVVDRNHRLGISVTGLLQSKWANSPEVFDAVYRHLRNVDAEYSYKYNVPRSIKLTAVKPSGTVSLLPGVTPGIHGAYSDYYIRRIRMSSNDALVNLCKSHGYKVEPQYHFDGSVDHTTSIIEFPVDHSSAVKAADISAVEQLEIQKMMQQYWADNSVSVTVYYHDSELPEIQEWLKSNYTRWVKAVSFLRHQDHGFKQAPYEAITKETYDSLIQNVTPITATNVNTYRSVVDEDCESGVCPTR